MSPRNGGDRGTFENAFVKIIEQPATKAKRFRYESESKSHRGGSIPGVNSSPDNKTYPTLQIINYHGPAAVVVSCVTKDKPYRAHPHRLMGKDRRDTKGIYTLEMNHDEMTVKLSDLTIQYVKRNDIGKSLNERARAKVDPFNNGFDHATNPSNIDMKAIRLCFQVFLKGSGEHMYNIPLAPIVSEPIHNKDAMSDLKIVKLSAPSSSAAGGEHIILLCEKVAKDDIKVRFFERVNDTIVWEDYGHFHQNDVHKGVAISFRTPKYKTRHIDKSVKCFIQLQKISDDSTSEALPFEYFPLLPNRRSLIDKTKCVKNRTHSMSCVAATNDDLCIQQQNDSPLTETTGDSVCELLNFGVYMPNTRMVLTQVETQHGQYRPQFETVSYTAAASSQNTNLLNHHHHQQQQPHLQQQQQPPMSIPQHASDNSCQPQFNSINHSPMTSPQDAANILNHQYQLNIPNATLVDAVLSFMDNNSNQNEQNQQHKDRNMEEILLNHNLDHADRLDNETGTNNDDVILDSFSGMSISSGPILDSQFAIEMCSDFIRHLDNNGGETMVRSNHSDVPNIATHNWTHNEFLCN